MKFFLQLAFMMLAMSGLSQEVVKLNNPSFEDRPKRGGSIEYSPIKDWFDCGRINFRRETPPDIHPLPKGMWGNFKNPQHGNTYLGIVVRDNNTWESLSQRLETPLLAEQCYEFSVVLARNNRYLSPSRVQTQYYDNDKLFSFTTPTVLRIWGGDDLCNVSELLMESEPIDHNDWKQYTFNIKPKKDYNFITIEAFYEVPVLELYNGHILIDNFSAFIPIDCPSEVDIYAVDKISVDTDMPQEAIASATKPKTRKPKTKVKKPVKKVEKRLPDQPKEVIKPKTRSTAKILTELNDKSLKRGQTFEIRNLNFKADTSSINTNSHAVLDEVYNFLDENPTVKIEIGGHTNNIPEDEYCNTLSMARARSVKEYLVQKGISEERIETMGYGKNYPIASNKTIAGRKKNQRVEIKILET